MTISALVATAAAASGIALGSPGAARPAFAPAYVGTAQGTLRMPGRTDTWTVQGLTFKLQERAIGPRALGWHLPRDRGEGDIH